MGKEDKKKATPNRRCGFSRRLYEYAHHIPERRNRIDRRAPENECAELTDQLAPVYDDKPALSNPLSDNKKSRPNNNR